MDTHTQFTIPGRVVFEPGHNGLVRARITAPHADAEVYLHGAHVTEFRPRGQAPVLMMSAASVFAAGEPIRGGIPVIFPWFGPRRDGKEGPPHAFARRRDWEVESTAAAPGGTVTLVLGLASDAATRAAWPGEFRLRYTVTVGPTLHLALAVTNTGATPFTFEEALHTYFTVGDIRQVRVAGLENGAYLDAADGGKRKRQGPDPITFAEETDRAYIGTPAVCELYDQALGRRLVITKAAADSTVVWNPWIAKAKRMPDFGDDEWPGMVCVETGNVLENAVTLAPGATHEMTTTVEVAALGQ